MGTAIRLLAAVTCSLAVAVTATLSQTDRRAPRQGGDAAQRQQRAAEEASCPFCVDPCKLKEQLKKGELTVVDAVGGKGRKIEKLWIIDARPGFHQPCTETEETYYVGSPRTRVYIINMNPFLFDYTITKTEEKVPETAQVSFLNKLGGPLFEGLGSATTATGQGTSAAADRGEQSCQTALSTARVFLEAKEKVIADLERRFEEFRQSYEGTRAAYILLLDPLATCLDLCRGANSFKVHYANLPDKYKFEDLFLEVEREEGLITREASLRADRGIARCQGRTAEELRAKERELLRRVEILKDKLSILCENLFKENGARLAAMSEAIDIVFKRPDLLMTQTFVVGGYADATKVKITVEPKTKATAERLPNNRGGPPRPCAPAPGSQGGSQQGGQPGGQQGGQQGQTPEQPVREATPTPTPTPTP